MRRRVAGILALLTGCAADGLKSADDTAAVAPPIQVSVQAALQQSGWGAGLGRCEVSVSFTHPPETDGMYEQPAQLWDPLAMPTEDGDCALTLRDPEAMQDALDANPEPSDNWALTGTVDVGDTVQLVGSTHALTLDAVWDDAGAEVQYAWPDCSAEDFPRGEAFDLVVAEGAPDDGIAPFTLADVLAAGPGITLTGIGREPGVVRTALVQGEDASMRWSYDGALPVLDQPVEHSVRALVRNSVEGGLNEFQGLVCLSDPADGSLGTEVRLPGAALARMSPRTATAPDLYLQLQLDSITTGPEVTAPWGQRIRVQSVVSVDGRGSLRAARIAERP